MPHDSARRSGSMRWRTTSARPQVPVGRGDAIGEATPSVGPGEPPNGVRAERAGLRAPSVGARARGPQVPLRRGRTPREVRTRTAAGSTVRLSGPAGGRSALCPASPAVGLPVVPLTHDPTKSTRLQCQPGRVRGGVRFSHGISPLAVVAAGGCGWPLVRGSLNGHGSSVEMTALMVGRSASGLLACVGTVGNGDNLLCGPMVGQPSRLRWQDLRARERPPEPRASGR